MINTIEDLDKALKVLRDHGVTHFKMKDFDISLEQKPLEIQLPNDLNPKSFPEQSELDKMVGMPVGDIDDPFLDYSVVEPEKEE